MSNTNQCRDPWLLPKTQTKDNYKIILKLSQQKNHLLRVYVRVCHSLLLHFQSWRRTVLRRYSRKWTPWTNARGVSSAGRLSATCGTTTTCTSRANTRAASARRSIPAATPCWCTAVPNIRNWTCEDGSQTLTHYCFLKGPTLLRQTAADHLPVMDQ